MKLKINLEQIESITYKLDDTTKISVSIENGELNIETIKTKTQDEINQELVKDRFNMLWRRNDESMQKYVNESTEKFNEMRNAYDTAIRNVIDESNHQQKKSVKNNYSELSQTIPSGTTIRNFKEVCEKADEIVKKQREDVKKHSCYSSDVVKLNLKEMIGR